MSHSIHRDISECKGITHGQSLFYCYYTWVVIVFGYPSFKHGIILITRWNGVIEPDSINYSSEVIIENIRHFAWVINDIIIFT